MFDFQNKWPRTVHMYTMLFAHMNSSFNPIVYAISNPLYQKGYKNLFKKIFFCKKNINKVAIIQPDGLTNPSRTIMMREKIKIITFY